MLALIGRLPWVGALAGLVALWLGLGALVLQAIRPLPAAGGTDQAARA